MKTNDFDPLAYIENAFLDKNPPAEPAKVELEDKIEIPTIVDYLHLRDHGHSEPLEEDVRGPLELNGHKTKFRKTVMSAPRPRRAKGPVAPSTGPALEPGLQQVWETLPKSIDFLCEFFDDSVTAHYYRGDFKETRQDLIRRLLDPELSLEETSRLLGVCPATVRRYTNRGWLEHHRTTGGQRRFRLSNIVKFVEAHGRFPEA